MIENNNKDCLHSSGVGGPFCSLIAGITGFFEGCVMRYITPLICFITVPLAIISPAVYACFVRCGLRGEVQGATGIAALPKVILGRFPLMLMLTLAWYLAIAVAFFYIDIRSNQAMAIYEEAAKSHQVLQIGTPEQLEFSRQVTQSIAYCGLALVLIFSILISIAMAAAAGSKNALKAGFKAWGVNLPGYIVLAVITIVVFAVIEKYFAILKLRFLEASIMNKEAFDPFLVFMLLRLYALNAVAVASAIMAAISLKLCRYRFARRFSSKQDNIPEPKGPKF